jgi:hypothetical protein
MSTITPANIMAAAFIAQIAIWVIMFVGASMLVFDDHGTGSSFAPWAILTCFLLTTMFLVFTNELSNLWRPLFPGTTFTGIPLGTALALMFVTDAILVMFLVAITGGSHPSPFTPIYFLLPVLAIFLRESPSKVLFYTALVSIFFSINIGAGAHIIGPGGDYGDRRRRSAYWVVSIASFALATWIGLITRPR